ncbi:DeoR family transcriptional regulator [Photobacterium sp. DNB22_13_2]
MAESSLDLNNPVTRQNWLLEQLGKGKTLIAKEVAEELGVSLDTIRRDLIALEQQGEVKRVKGGAIASSVPDRPFIDRIKDADVWLSGSQSLLQSLLDGVETLFLDGGTSILKVANAIPVNSSITVITPSPVVAGCRHGVAGA